MNGPPTEPRPHRHDPRGRGFRDRTSVADLWAMIDARVGRLGEESVGLLDAAGRVLAGDLVASDPVPGFDRAAMDGYALRGEETFGADADTPAPFRVVGRSRPGHPATVEVGPGQAVAIATGAPLPPGADAVAKVETARLQGDEILVGEPVPPGRHVSRRGEDVEVGTIVLEAGRVLRPQDLAAASGLGRSEVLAVRRPRVYVLITGDELLPPGTPPRGCSIPDANSPMLSALLARDGAFVGIIGPLPDDREALRETVADLAERSDAILISGGSSTGPEDHAPGVVAELGELAVHGVAVRPAGPTGLGFVNGVPVVLLPGNPVSCLCAYDLFAGRVVRRLGGRAGPWPYRSVVLALAKELASPIGRTDYARVKVGPDGIEPVATGGASIVSGVTRADGFVVVPADVEGFSVGAEVTAWLYD